MGRRSREPAAPPARRDYVVMVQTLKGWDEWSWSKDKVSRVATTRAGGLDLQEYHVTAEYYGTVAGYAPGTWLAYRVTKPVIEGGGDA